MDLVCSSIEKVKWNFSSYNRRRYWGLREKEELFISEMCSKCGFRALSTFRNEKDKKNGIDRLKKWLLK
jgi:hypothetical protein